jgi:hypothetical protein
LQSLRSAVEITEGILTALKKECVPLGDANDMRARAKWAFRKSNVVGKLLERLRSIECSLSTILQLLSM